MDRSPGLRRNAARLVLSGCMALIVLSSALARADDVPVTDRAQLALISPGAKLGGSVGLSWVDNLKPRSRPCDVVPRAGQTDAFTVFDPNCVRVAFAQIQKESFEQSLAK